jgi:hypothetical protein
MLVPWLWMGERDDGGRSADALSDTNGCWAHAGSQALKRPGAGDKKPAQAKQATGKKRST